MRLLQVWPNNSYSENTKYKIYLFILMLSVVFYIDLTVIIKFQLMQYIVIISKINCYLSMIWLIYSEIDNNYV